MKNASNSQSRRDFIKGVAVNTASLSAVPLGMLGSQSFFPDPKTEAPRLPLRIMMRSGVPDSYREKLLKISNQIQLEEGMEAIGQVNAWHGPISKEQFIKATNLQWVHSSSAGVENYMYPELVESKVVLTNSRGCFAPCMAEHAFALLFTLTRGIGIQNRNMLQSKWQGASMESVFELKGLTMGIVGLGGIGSQVARRARAMDMRVLAVDIMPKYREQLGDICDEVRLVQDGGLSWMLPKADVIVLSAPHTKASEGMIGPEQFGIMKKGTFFINVCRGKLVKTPALLDALKTGKIAGAGLDVTDPEPLPSDHELWKLPNVIITAHMSGRSQFNPPRLAEVFVENVYRYVNNFPMLNIVNKEMGF